VTEVEHGESFSFMCCALTGTFAVNTAARITIVSRDISILFWRKNGIAYNSLGRSSEDQSFGETQTKRQSTWSRAAVFGSVLLATGHTEAAD
jgi:hypothetical protein